MLTLVVKAWYFSRYVSSARFFNHIANSDIEATKCPPISPPSLSALRDRSIHYRRRNVCLSGTVHNGEWTPLRGLYTVGSHRYCRGAGLHTLDLTTVDPLILVYVTFTYCIYASSRFGHK